MPYWWNNYLPYGLELSFALHCILALLLITLYNGIKMASQESQSNNKCEIKVQSLWEKKRKSQNDAAAA